jgi:hypothetical protein
MKLMSLAFHFAKELEQCKKLIGLPDPILHARERRN